MAHVGFNSTCPTSEASLLGTADLGPIALQLDDQVLNGDPEIHVGYEELTEVPVNDGWEKPKILMNHLNPNSYYLEVTQLQKYSQELLLVTSIVTSELPCASQYQIRKSEALNPKPSNT